MSVGDPSQRGARDPMGARDDMVAPFQIEGRPVRGRIARLAEAADAVLGAHAYPEAVTGLVGEALLVVVLIGNALKFEGRLVVQATGEGPVSLLVADYETSGGIRGYAKVDAERFAALAAEHPHPTAAQLLGAGHLALTIDQGPVFDLYQSFAPLEGDTLARAAEAYFEQSEQVPTRIRLAVAKLQVPGEPSRWRAGGALLQRIAADDARGETDDAWETASALFDTLGLDELVDPRISAGELLFRLFHEDGVRLSPGLDIVKRCSCERERIARILASFPTREVSEMRTEGGDVRVTCEFCNRNFDFALADIDAAGGR